nr:tetratricopeptide repeat protein [Chloroflexota bacterium]
VPIEPVREPALVAPTIARTLGVSDSATRPAIDGLVEALGDRRVLLVLDNFEQVIDAAPVTAELLRRCPNLTILVSSRAVLRVSGEQEYPVPGLPTPPDTSGLSEVERLNLPRAVVRPDAAALEWYESVRLFLARASAIRPGFRLTDANAPAIARIVAGLHGMPLAIELAAARVRLLTPEQIVARLEDRLALLTSGSRDLPERQQTLRGAIAWSYELLDPGARRLVDRLSVFIGGWELEAAEAVCGPAGELGVEVVDGLATLVDQSLVRAVETTDGEAIRYTTFDTIREFAAEMLAVSGDEAVVRERHARAYLDLAERAAPELSGADQRGWLDRLERDHGNLRAALTWAVERPEPAVAVRLVFALWRFWQQRGYQNEAWDRVVGIADHGWELPPVLAGHLAEAIGGIAYWRADYRPAADWYGRALDLWRTIGDEREIANALYNASYAVLIRFMEGNPLDGTQVEGRAMLDEALALYEKLGDEVGIGNIEWAIGSYTYFIEGIAAEPWYRRSLERHRRTGQRTMEAWSLHMLALTVLRQNRTEEAREHAGHALRHFRDAGDIAGITLVLDDLSGVAVADGDLPRAGRLWGAARNLQKTTGTMLAAIADTGLGLMDFPTARGALSPDDLERYSAEGAALPLQELIDYAFEGAQGRTSLEDVQSPDAGRSV